MCIRDSCKASCINIKAHEIDYSRCVACMHCIIKYRNGAITYTRRKTGSAAVSQDSPVSPEQVNDARRAFLSTTAVFAATAALKAQEKKEMCIRDSHHFITRLQTTDHFYKLKVGIAQLHLALYNFLVGIAYKKFILPTSHIIVQKITGTFSRRGAEQPRQH